MTFLKQYEFLVTVQFFGVAILFIARNTYLGFERVNEITRVPINFPIQTCAFDGVVFPFGLYEKYDF